jgi:hypothetical protein
LRLEERFLTFTPLDWHLVPLLVPFTWKEFIYTGFDAIIEMNSYEGRCSFMNIPGNSGGYGFSWRYDIDGNKVSVGPDGKELFSFTADGDPATYTIDGKLVDCVHTIDGDRIDYEPAGGRRGSSDWRVNIVPCTSDQLDEYRGSVDASWL